MAESRRSGNPVFSLANAPSADISVGCHAFARVSWERGVSLESSRFGSWP